MTANPTHLRELLAEIACLKREVEKLQHRLDLLGDAPDPNEDTLFALSTHHTWHHQRENELAAKLQDAETRLAAAERATTGFFIVPMPLDANGNGPANATDTVRTVYEIWDDCNRTVSGHDTREAAFGTMEELVADLKPVCPMCGCHYCDCKPLTEGILKCDAVDTAKLRELLAAATAGPWEDASEPSAPEGEDSRAVVTAWVHGQLESKMRIACRCRSAEHHWVHIRPADAALIVALRNEAPGLLDELDAMRREVEKLDKIERVAAHYSDSRMNDHYQQVAGEIFAIINREDVK